MARVFVTRRLPGTALDRLDADLLAAAPKLRAIANYAIGFDNIDLAAVRARGIPVGVTPDVLTDATADLAWALMLAAARRLVEARQAVLDGEWRTWEPQGWLGVDVHGATLAVVGAGRIGQAVAKRASGFEMDVVLVDIGDDLHAALRRADFVSLHTPLTPDTRHLIDAEALAVMKPTAILVNTARGPIVDKVALAAALHEGRLGAAALDVTDPEPLPSDDPLLQAPNLIVADVGADGAFAQLERRTTVTRLGHGVDRTGVLDGEAMERVFATLRE